MGIDREEVRHRLTAGESLEISTGGGSYEVWVEPYANPAAVFYEGKALPYTALEDVIDLILEALEQDQVTCRWVEPQGIQTKTCQEAHRQRAASNSALSV
jgi:hypothetical protein